MHVFYKQSRTVIYEKGVANATLYLKSTLEADTPLCVLCTQETGYGFFLELHFMLFPEACFFFFFWKKFTSSIDVHLG